MEKCRERGIRKILSLPESSFFAFVHRHCTGMSDAALQILDELPEITEGIEGLVRGSTSQVWKEGDWMSGGSALELLRDMSA